MTDRPSFTDEEALAFHAGYKPGKLEIRATKPMATQRDLSLAYSIVSLIGQKSFDKL